MKRFELFFGFILLPVDIAMISAAFLLSYLVRQRFEVASLDLPTYFHYALIALPIWIGLIALNGLYSIQAKGGFFNEFYRIISASSTAILFVIVSIYLSQSDFSRLILIFALVCSIFTISFGRLMVRLIQQKLLSQGIGRKKLLIIGDNHTTLEIAGEIRSQKSSMYEFCGVMSDNLEKNKYGLKIVGSLDQDLRELLTEKKIEEVLLTDTSLPKKKMLEIMQTCQDLRITFKYVPEVFSLATINFKTKLIGSIQTMELESIPLDGWGRIIKRICDIVSSLVLLIILMPLMLIIALLIKLTSKGPVLYSNKRIGRNENTFGFIKFRSMYLDQCDYTAGAKWTTQSDDETRITPIGKLLRKTNLDELPQLWNILIGDMSVVGPRPELPKFVEKFEKEIPEYFRRHKVKVGLTGWAQVNGLKGDTSIKERVRYDIYYIENWSLWLDLKIIFKTIGLIIYETIFGKYEYRNRP